MTLGITHPQHSRQYLRAVLTELYLRRDGKSKNALLQESAQRAIDHARRAVNAPVQRSVCA